ncbi:glucuronyl n-acetylglucosaminyl transferase ext2 [Nannochloropsis oceanica]
MRRPYHRVGRGTLDGLESGGRIDPIDLPFSWWRLRGCSSRSFYMLSAVLIVGCLVLHLTHLALQTAFQVELLPATSRTGGVYGSTYTIRVNSFRRNDMLKGFLQHFATCPNVEAIHVVWSDQENKPPSMADWALPLTSDQLEKVQFEEQPTDSLNNRFRVLLPVPTPAVLSLDDDLVIPCGTLDFAFSVWQAAPHSLVGFTPRLITWDAGTSATAAEGETEGNEGGSGSLGGSYRYQSSFKYVWWHGRYNLILTKCCFLHREFLSLYFSSLSSATLDYIDQKRNCEDIAMQFVVSNHTGCAPPVWVQAKVTDHGQTSGISQGQDHANERNRKARTRRQDLLANKRADI